jgi:hypothetical protein
VRDPEYARLSSNICFSRCNKAFPNLILQLTITNYFKEPETTKNNLFTLNENKFSVKKKNYGALIV